MRKKRNGSMAGGGSYAFISRCMATALFTSLISSAYAVDYTNIGPHTGFDPRNGVFAGEAAIPNATQLNTEGTYIVNPAAAAGSQIRFGKWNIGLSGEVIPDDASNNIATAGGVLQDTGMLQRVVTDSSGNKYVQLVIADGEITDLDPANLASSFSESFVRMNGSGGVASFQGNRCIPDCNYINTNLLDPDHSLNYYNPLYADVKNYAENMAVVRTGSFEGPGEKTRFKMLLCDDGLHSTCWAPAYDPLDPDPKGGFSSYVDIWTGDWYEGTTNLGDYRRVAIETFDRAALVQNPSTLVWETSQYSYANLHVSGNFVNPNAQGSHESDPYETTHDSARAAAVTALMAANPTWTRADAANYIRTNIEFYLDESKGWREGTFEGFNQVEYRGILSGKFVDMAGSAIYTQTPAISASFDAGDRVFLYQVDQIADGQILGHQEFSKRYDPYYDSTRYDPLIPINERFNPLDQDRGKPEPFDTNFDGDLSISERLVRYAGVYGPQFTWDDPLIEFVPPESDPFQFYPPALPTDFDAFTRPFPATP